MKVVISSNSFWNLYNFRLGIIRELIKHRHNVYLLASDDKYTEYFREIGCFIYPLKIKKNNKSFFSDIFLFKSYLAILYKINPDIHFLFTIKPNIYGSIASAILKIKYINTVTGLGTFFLRSSIFKNLVFFLYRFAFLKSSTVFFHNNDDLSIFKNRRIVKNNGLVIPGSGVNLIDFNFNKSIN